MNKELKAFRKICKNLNSYEFTDECKKNKKLIETALEEKEQDKKFYNKITRANLEIGQNNERLNELINKQLNDLIKLETFVKIIKEKLVFNFNDKAKSITITRNNGLMHITLFFDKQTEYNILKEILL